MSETSLSGRKLHINFQRAHDRYCYYCEDGGPIMDCGLCSRGFCYDVMGGPEPAEVTADAEYQACITVPYEMKRDKSRIFRCPECLASSDTLKLDYTINRGSRATRRLSAKSSLVLVVYYLSSEKLIAESLLEQICAILGVFELHVVSFFRKIRDHVERSEAKELYNQLLPDGPYHLCVIFLTESSPEGGWWVTSDKDRGGRSQAEEPSFLKLHTSSLSELARSAISARMFMICCSLNFWESSTLGKIHNYLDACPWHSIVFPSAPQLLPQFFINFMPELFAQLYYFGAPLRSALLRTWGKSLEARAHTGLVIMDRKHWEGEELTVTKFEHAPQSTRPFGFELPMVPSL
ncbi:hypothetical protein FRC06_004357, partial [Ceratobasidium sp. 370]